MRKAYYTQDGRVNITLYSFRMLVSIPPKLSVSDFMDCLKEKSALMIFERHANRKCKYEAKGYYASTVRRNKAAITTYTRGQETEDQMADQPVLKEYEDPFKK